MPSESSESGAVTAEFMILLPSLILLAAVLASLLGLGLDRVALERSAGSLLRELSIGRELVTPAGTEVKTWSEGRLVCLELKKTGPLPIIASHCAMPLT